MHSRVGVQKNSSFKIAGVTIAAAASCALAAGCSGGSSTTASAGTSVTAAASTATKVTCSQLTYADVQPLMVDTITAIKVIPADDTATFNSDVAGLGTDAATVPGIGNKAVRDGGHGSEAVSAIKGSEYCRVTPGDGEIPGVGALEKATGDSSNIGDAKNALETAAAATLSNRVFGSGNTTPDLSGLLAHASVAATTSPSDQDSLPSTFAIPTDSAS